MQVLPLIGIAASVGGQIFKGVAANNAGKYNQSVDEANAVDALRDGTAQVARQRDQARIAMGRQIGAQGESGFEVGTGSALDNLMQSATDAELDAMDTRRQAMSRYNSYMQQGSQDRTAGKNALVSGLIGGAGALASGVQDYATKKKSGVY